MTVDKYTYSKVTDQHIAELVTLLDVDRVSIRDADLTLHARDQSFHKPHPPEVVIWPTTTAEVSRVLKFANDAHIAVTAWGAGTSLEGNPLAMYGGIVMDFSRMNNIVNVRAEDFQVDVQPGITRVELNKALARYGLFFPPDPGANASIGGMIANNAAGIKTVKYGATKDNVMRLEVVLANGEILHVGTRARKDSSGYDLLHLFVGSEGTLGVVTEATLKLAPLPANFSAVLAAFETIPAAMQTVIDIVGAGLEPSALEFLDTATVHALNTDRGMKWAEAPTIIMEFNGASDDAGLAAALDICRQNGALSFESAAGLEARNRLWDVRHHTYETYVRLNPGKAHTTVDVAVPLSKYPEIVECASQVLVDHHLRGHLLGHAGDGNLHVDILYDADSEAQFETMLAVNGLIVERAIELDGTATGEHGVGIGKRQYVIKQHGPALDVMRQIKGLLDPHWILNPGKIFT
jgi:D-lactate dehydrogenase (cytochrome)